MALTLVQRECSGCGFYRFRATAFFHCVGYQAILTESRRRCHFFTFGQPDPDRVALAQRSLRLPSAYPEFVPETEHGKTLLITQVLREKEAAKSGRVLTLSTTALITSGAKSQFETFCQKTDDLSTSGICR